MPATPEQFTLLGHRPSHLDRTLMCGAAGADPIDKSGRAALMGTYFHAVCEQSPGALELVNLLMKEERDEVNGWSAPLPITLDGVELNYGYAEHEVELGLTTEGKYAASGEVLTGGTADMVWHLNGTVYVGDIKKRTESVFEGAESLQLTAYGLAAADKYKARTLRCGLWDATEAFWLWGNPIDMEWDAPALFELVKAAALNPKDRYTTGAHCRGCYRRLRCDAHVLPPVLQRTELAALTQDGITPENVAELARVVFAGIDVFNQARETLKAYVLQGGEIRDGKRVWRSSTRKGRESVSVKDLRAGLGDQAEGFIKRGQDYEQFDWVKG
jgi:hypothetical protein